MLEGSGPRSMNLQIWPRPPSCCLEVKYEVAICEDISRLFSCIVLKAGNTEARCKWSWSPLKRGKEWSSLFIAVQNCTEKSLWLYNLSIPWGKVQIQSQKDWHFKTKYESSSNRSVFNGLDNCLFSRCHFDTRRQWTAAHSMCFCYTENPL